MLLLERKLADKVAAAGYYVLVPDFLHGDPFTSENANRPLPVWLKDHQPVSFFISKIRYSFCACLEFEALKCKKVMLTE